jgi:hypothetical protein
LKILTLISVRFFFAITLLTIVLASCKKDLNNTITVTASDGIPPFPLNWETADYMPAPAGTTILVPWANGSVKGFSSDIWYDYKINDGWSLVYNVFNTSLLPANPWFALYNKYRGLLRIYVYVTTSGFTTSSYLTSGLNLAPNSVNSSMLNYIGQDLIDASQNKSVATKIEPTQIATGAWYASQYEIAYDPQISTSTFQQLGLNWTLKWTSVSGVSLQGTQQGTLNGTISTPAPSFNLAGALTNGALEATGLAIFQNNKGSASDYSKNTLGLPAKAFGAIQDGLTSGLNGVVKNLFSAIFGGSSANTQEVNLTLNAQISLTGNITQSGALIPDPGLGLGIPGISNSQSASGYIPAYNQPMGVLNLSGKPTINRVTTRTQGPTYYGIPYNRYVINYSVDNSIFNSLFITNPAVINSTTGGAAIQNLRTSVMLLNPDNTSDYFQGYGTLETIGSYTAYTGNPVTITYDVEHSSYPQNNFAAIRVVADVVPNNGAPKSTIVKTFIANIIGN